MTDARTGRALPENRCCLKKAKKGRNVALGPTPEGAGVEKIRFYNQPPSGGGMFLRLGESSLDCPGRPVHLPFLWQWPMERSINP